MGEIAALTAAALWASASIMFARLGRDISPTAMNLLKCGIAGVFLAATLALMDGRIWPTDLPVWETSILAVSGVIGLTIGDTAFFGALNRIGSRRTLVLWALAPPITALLAVPVVGEPITLKMVLGISLTVGGVMWVILERNQEETDEHDHDGWTRAEKIGIALGAGTALCQATGNVLAKLGGGEIAALDISVIRLAFGSVGLAVALAFTRRLGEVVEPMKVPKRAGVLVAATFIGTYLGLWLSMAGIRYTYTGVASTLNSTTPIFILPLAYLFEDEEITARAVVGACIAVVGIGVLFVNPEHIL